MGVCPPSQGGIEGGRKRFSICPSSPKWTYDLNWLSLLSHPQCPVFTPFASSALLHPSPHTFFEITGHADPAGPKPVIYALCPACPPLPLSLQLSFPVMPGAYKQRGGTYWYQRAERGRKAVEIGSRSKHLLHLEYRFAEAYLIR